METLGLLIITILALRCIWDNFNSITPNPDNSKPDNNGQSYPHPVLEEPDEEIAQIVDPRPALEEPDEEIAQIVDPRPGQDADALYVDTEISILKSKI